MRKEEESSFQGSERQTRRGSRFAKRQPVQLRGRRKRAASFHRTKCLFLALMALIIKTLNHALLSLTRYSTKAEFPNGRRQVTTGFKVGRVGEINPFLLFCGSGSWLIA